jgi:hypothetical protein
MNLKKEILKILKEKNLLTVSQYAKKHGYSEQYVMRLCRQKKLIAHKLQPGNMWAIEK